MNDGDTNEPLDGGMTIYFWHDEARTPKSSNLGARSEG